MAKNEDIKEYLDNYAQQMRKYSSECIGYPVKQQHSMAQFYEWYAKSDLSELLLLDVGNPFQESHYPLNTRTFEREVISYFADLYQFSRESFWGFVTSSGTDGNMHGLFFGRKTLKYKTGLDPVLYVSHEAHYSVNKNLPDLLQITTVKIDTYEDGTLNYDDFSQKLIKDRPALICVSIGTTFKGAIDDPSLLTQFLQEHEIEHFYVHLDAALMGGHLAYLQNEGRELVSHKKHHYDSISVSGHKFFGFDEPLGIFLTTGEVASHIDLQEVDYLSTPSNYNNSLNKMITCSRSSLKTLKWWWKIKTTPYEQFVKEAHQLVDLAFHLKKSLKWLPLPSWSAPYSNTVYFLAPESSIVSKYYLATQRDERLGALAHIVVMQQVTPNIIDAFLEDLLLSF